MIDWINERSNQITEDFDLPITDVNLVTFLIKVYSLCLSTNKYFYRSLPTLILNHLDLSTVSSCKTIQVIVDEYRIKNRMFKQLFNHCLH